MNVGWMRVRKMEKSSKAEEREARKKEKEETRRNTGRSTMDDAISPLFWVSLALFTPGLSPSLSLGLVHSEQASQSLWPPHRPWGRCTNSISPLLVPNFSCNCNPSPLRTPKCPPLRLWGPTAIDPDLHAPNERDCQRKPTCRTRTEPAATWFRRSTMQCPPPQPSNYLSCSAAVPLPCGSGSSILPPSTLSLRQSLLEPVTCLSLSSSLHSITCRLIREFKNKRKKKLREKREGGQNSLSFENNLLGTQVNTRGES